MSEVNGCNLPEDLYYLYEKHVWVRPEAGGLLTVGLNDVAQHLAGNVLNFTPKKVGRAVPKGQSLATIESAKWVGPVPAPVAGEIAEINEAIRADPKILNQDPYGAGWIARIRPSDWEGEKAGLVSGPVGLETYRAFLNAQGIRCDKPAGA